MPFPETLEKLNNCIGVEIHIKEGTSCARGDAGVEKKSSNNLSFYSYSITPSLLLDLCSPIAVESLQSLRVGASRSNSPRPASIFHIKSRRHGSSQHAPVAPRRVGGRFDGVRHALSLRRARTRLEANGRPWARVRGWAGAEQEGAKQESKGTSGAGSSDTPTGTVNVTDSVCFVQAKEIAHAH